MLYLAEVEKQKVAIIGSHRTELKLLASQGNDQMWNPIAGNEVLVCENITEQTAKGALYMLNLGTNNEIQGVPELAGPRLVNYLKHFSRLVEKSNNQEKEIAQWKESLQLQSEEITNRQLELDNQQEKLQNLEEDLARLEEEKTKLEEEKNKLQDTWNEVLQEQKTLADNTASGTLHNKEIEELIENFSNCFIDTSSLKEYYQNCLTTVQNQQAKLEQYSSELEEEKNHFEEQQNNLNETGAKLEQSRKEVNSTLENLQQVKLDLEIQRSLINQKEEVLIQINFSLEEMEFLTKQMNELKEDIAEDENEQDIDFDSLERMTLEELEEAVKNLQEDTAKSVNFVNMQEEELTEQKNYIKELEDKLAHSSQTDKYSIDIELNDAKEAMKFLNETLVGQRRSKKKKQKILNQHIKFFYRKKGFFELETVDTVQVDPIVQTLQSKNNLLRENKDKLESQIETLKQSVEPIERMVEQQHDAYEMEENLLREDEQDWIQSQIRLNQIECKMNFLQEAISPLQESLTQIYSDLQNMENSLNTFDETANQQSELAGKMQEIFTADNDNDID